MRKPHVTFDAILAALAVLSTSAACSKAERAAAEPATATPAATMTAPASAAPPLAAQPATPPAAAPTAAPSDELGNAKNAVDAGKERKAPAGPAPNPTKGGSAACGATGCSAEMRKGGK